MENFCCFVFIINLIQRDGLGLVYTLITRTNCRTFLTVSEQNDFLFIFTQKINKNSRTTVFLTPCMLLNLLYYCYFVLSEWVKTTSTFVFQPFLQLSVLFTLYGVSWASLYANERCLGGADWCRYEENQRPWNFCKSSRNFTQTKSVKINF